MHLASCASTREKADMRRAAEKDAFAAAARLPGQESGASTERFIHPPKSAPAAKIPVPMAAGCRSGF
jgi:hypothetical protein